MKKIIKYSFYVLTATTSIWWILLSLNLVFNQEEILSVLLLMFSIVMLYQTFLFIVILLLNLYYRLKNKEFHISFLIMMYLLFSSLVMYLILYLNIYDLKTFIFYEV